MKLMKFVALGTLALTLSLGTADAQGRKDPRQTNIEQRQAFYKLVGLYVGPLRSTDRGDMDYNAETLNAAVANLALLVQLDQSKLWTPGADRSFMEASLTLPKIFEDPAVIPKLNADMQAAVNAMIPAAGAGLEAFKAAYATMNATCAACHDDYRHSDN